MSQTRYVARTTAEAAIQACEELGLTRSELKYEVVEDTGEGLSRQVTIAVTAPAKAARAPQAQPREDREEREDEVRPRPRSRSRARPAEDAAPEAAADAGEEPVRETGRGRPSAVGRPRSERAPSATSGKDETGDEQEAPAPIRRSRSARSEAPAPRSPSAYDDGEADGHEEQPASLRRPPAAPASREVFDDEEDDSEPPRRDEVALGHEPRGAGRRDQGRGGRTGGRGDDRGARGGSRGGQRAPRGDEYPSRAGGRSDERQGRSHDDRGNRSAEGGRSDNSQASRGRSPRGANHDSPRQASPQGEGRSQPQQRQGGESRRRPQRSGPGLDALLELRDPVGDLAPLPAIASESPRSQAACDLVAKLTSLMDLKVDVALVREDEAEIHVHITGEDEKRVIGQRGEVLLALQFLANRLLGRAEQEDEADQVLVLDAGGHRQRRHTAIANLATSLAERALQENKAVRLSPMSAHDRRIFHMALKDMDGITTQSEGDGMLRNLLIVPAALVEG